MKKIYFIATLIVSGFLSVFGQNLMTANKINLDFTGTFNGNYYASQWANIATFGGINMGNSCCNPNGTTTGVSDRYAYSAQGSTGLVNAVYNSMTNVYRLNVNTPNASSYGATTTILGPSTGFIFDSRYHLAFSTSGTPALNNANFNFTHTTPVVNISANPNMTFEVTNNTGSAGAVMIDFYDDRDVFGGNPNYRRDFAIASSGKTFVKISTLASTKIRGFRFRTSGLVGNIDVDNLCLGCALPTSTNISAAGGATSLLGGNTLQFTSTPNSGDDFYQNTANSVVYAVVNPVSESNAASIDASGLLTASSSILQGTTVVVTVTSASVYNTSSVSRYILSIAGTATSVVTVSGVTIAGNATMNQNSTLQLTAGVQPSNANNQSLSWSSSNTSIATVNSSGLVTAVSFGNVTITATSVDNANASASLAIKVNAVPDAANASSSKFKETFDMTVAGWSGNYFFPAPINWPYLTGAWMNFLQDEVNPSLAELGNVRAYRIANGTGTAGSDSPSGAMNIYATTPDPATYGNTTSVVGTNPIKFDSRSRLIYAMFGSITGTSLTTNSNTQFSAIITNHSASDAQVRIGFTEGFLNVFCCVTENGTTPLEIIVPANSTRYIQHGVGSQSNINAITFRTTNFTGHISIDEMKIGYVLPTSVTVSTPGDVTTIAANGSMQLSATLSPENSAAEYPQIEWTVSPSTFGTISGTGLLTAGAYTSTLTVTGKSRWSGTLLQTRTISVVGGSTYQKNVESVSINGPSAIAIDDDALPVTNYTATVLPIDATDLSVTWSVTPTTHASISNSGTLTPVNGLSITTPTVVTITATSVYTSSVSGIKVVTLNPKIYSVTGVSVTNTANIVTVGGTLTMTGSVAPANATNKSLTWTVAPLTLATISANGVLSVGTVAGIITVTATSVENNAISGTKVLTIVGIPSGTVISISVSGPALLEKGKSAGYTVAAANTLAGIVSWTVDPISVASINSSGVLTALEAGTVTITATSLSVAGVSAVFIVTITEPSSVGAFGNSGFVKASLLPNPATDLVRVVSGSKVLSVQVLNTSGSVVASSGSEVVTISALFSGVYIVKVQTAEGVAILKLIKE